MFKFILSALLCLTFRLPAGAAPLTFDAQTAASGVQLKSVDVGLLSEAMSTTTDSNDLLLKLVEAFPELVVIVGPVAQVAGWSQNVRVAYVDPRLSVRVRNHFLACFKSQAAGGIFWGELGATFTCGSDVKVKLQSPILAVHANTSRNTIVHEFLHYLFHRARAPVDAQGALSYDANQIALMNFAKKWEVSPEALRGRLNFVPQMIEDLQGATSEHVDVISILLKNAALVGSTPAEVLEDRERLELYVERMQGHLYYLESPRELVRSLEDEGIYSASLEAALLTELRERSQDLKTISTDLLD